MQLAAAYDNNFVLGHASMMVNEGLPSYVVSRLGDRFDLSSMTVGILGMAFKGESDDIRSSLSYKLKRILSFKASRVLCTDPYVTVDENLVPLDAVLDEADLLIVGAPHRVYRRHRDGHADGRHLEPLRRGRAGVSPRVSVDHHGVQRRRAHRRLPRPRPRVRHPPMRGARGVRRTRRHDGAIRGEVREGGRPGGRVP